MFSKLFGGKKASADAEGKPFTQDPAELWYIDGKAYDLAKFVKAHPGGADVLLELKGKDGTAEFKEAHGDSAAPQKKLLRMEVKNVPAEVLAAKFGGAAAPAEAKQQAAP